MINEITRRLGRAELYLKKYSPEILLGIGVVGTVAGTVMACKATTKLQKILDKKDEDMDNVHKVLNSKEYKDKYSEEDAKKDTTIIYTQTAMKIAKLYLPSVLMIGGSLGCMIAGHKILKGRNIALAAAYTAVDTGFKKYRKNVVEKLGEQADKEFRNGLKVQEVTIKDKNGKDKKEKQKVMTIDGVSDYARFFDELCTNYTKDAEYNLMYLRRQQDYYNDVLKARGHVFLNEVYDSLGIPRTKAGQIVGWVYDLKNPKGDNYIDFNIYNNRNIDFVNGYERSILLDFNVDGPIFDLVGKEV